MRAVLMVARADLSARARFWASLVAVIAVAGGAVITLAAGARRTESAYPRFLVSQRASDAGMYLGGTTLTVAGVAALPEVAEASEVLGVPTVGPVYAAAIVTDGRMGVTMDRFKFLSGHNVQAADPFGVVVPFAVADANHLAVGSGLAISFAGPDGAPLPVTFTVVGIEASPGEFPPHAPSAINGVYLSPGFLSTRVGRELAPQAFSTVTLRLKHGARDIDPLTAAVNPSAQSVQSVQSVFVQSSAESAINTERSLRLQSEALWLVAGFVAMASVLVLAQLLAREAALEAGAAETRRALGMTTGQLVAAGLARMVLAAGLGAVAAVVLAGAASPLLPIGTARVAEPHPGFTLDAVALGFGALGIPVVVLGLAAATLALGFRRVSPRRDLVDGGALAGRMPFGSLPLVAGTGIRMALTPGRGRSAVPVRTTLTSIGIAVGAIAAALTYGASVNQVLAEPALYGVNFDAHVMAVANGPVSDARPILPVLQGDRDVAAVTIGDTQLDLRIGAVSFGGQRQVPVVGSIAPVLLEGRLPRTPDEMALGATTLRQAHRKVGDRVKLQLTALPVPPVAERIVGVVILPSIADNEGLGKGAVLAPGFTEYVASRAGPDVGPLPPPSDLFVRYREGVDASRKIAALQAAVTSTANVYPAEQPADVANFAQVRSLPEILAGLLGLIALATTLHLVLSAVRRRRRELAMLRTLGMVPRQVSWLVSWQATTIALVASLVGVPLGVALGRWVWSVVGSQLGVVVRPSVPVLAVAGLVPLAIVVANLVAIPAALAAGRIKPGAALQAE